MPGGEQEDPAAGGPEGEATGETTGEATRAGRTRASWRREVGRWEAWLSEGRRGYAAISLGLLLCLPGQIYVQSRTEAPFARFSEQLLLFIVAYLAFYIAITGLVLWRVPAERYLRWAERSQAGTWVEHYLMGTHPGPGTAQAVSSFALLIGVFWYPSAQADSALPGWATGALVASAVAAAWLTVAMTYSVAYLMQDARSGYRELEFPGDGPRRWTDYFYFSVGISTTFATPDVSVRTPRMRRTVTGHSVLAFGFNTVILAAVVSVLLR